MDPHYFEEALYYEAYPVYLLQNGVGFLLGTVFGLVMAVFGLLLVLQAKAPLTGFRLIGIAMLVYGITDAIGNIASWIDWGLLWGVQYQLGPMGGGLLRFFVEAGEGLIWIACLGLLGAGILSLVKALQSA